MPVTSALWQSWCAKTGDTLCDASRVVKLPAPVFPLPSLFMAVTVAKKGDEGKISSALARLMEEDPHPELQNNAETHQQIIGGLGEQHLDVVKAKLKNKFGVEIGLEAPRIAYRESIRKACQKQGRHKKQTGGHGQFGDVVINFEPCDSEQVVFEEKVFGGSVPKNFFPAVEKGVRLAAEKGVLAGYPVVGLKATLLDGSYHPVDSSEMAFIMAAKLAYKAAMPEAGPVILEPIHTLKAHVPNDNTGDIMGDVTKRRGRVLGMEPDEDGLQTIIAEVPLAELATLPPSSGRPPRAAAGSPPSSPATRSCPKCWCPPWWSRPRSWATWTKLRMIEHSARYFTEN